MPYSVQQQQLQWRQQQWLQEGLWFNQAPVLLPPTRQADVAGRL
jgi:hypothetical protein